MSDFVSFSLALSVAPSPNPSNKEALYSVTTILWARFCYVAAQPFTRARKSSEFSLSLPPDNLPRKRGKITEEKFENLSLLKVNNLWRAPDDVLKEPDQLDLFSALV